MAETRLMRIKDLQSLLSASDLQVLSCYHVFAPRTILEELHEQLSSSLVVPLSCTYPLTSFLCRNEHRNA